MFAQFSGGTPGPASRPTLDALMNSLGRTGLTASRSLPALLASVDQHAAAVRESLLGLAGGPWPAPGDALAAYAEGVRDAAARHGWRLPAGPVDWSAPDWVLTRLLAVCALMEPRPTAG